MKNRFRTKRSRILIGIASVFLLLFIASNWGCSTNTEQLTELEGKVNDQATAIAALSVATPTPLPTATAVPTATPQPTATPDTRIDSVSLDIGALDNRLTELLRESIAGFDTDLDLLQAEIDDARATSQTALAASRQQQPIPQELIDQVCEIRLRAFANAHSVAWLLALDLDEAEYWLNENYQYQRYETFAYHRDVFSLCTRQNGQWTLP